MKIVLETPAEVCRKCDGIGAGTTRGPIEFYRQVSLYKIGFEKTILILESPAFVYQGNEAEP
jgi:hypothetical protein